jgi:hypothetical protein
MENFGALEKIEEKLWEMAKMMGRLRGSLNDC